LKRSEGTPGEIVVSTVAKRFAEALGEWRKEKNCKSQLWGEGQCKSLLNMLFRVTQSLLSLFLLYFRGKR